MQKRHLTNNLLLQGRVYRYNNNYMKQASHTISLADAPFETIYVAHSRVACDGGGGALGHPRVYLTIDAEHHQVVCPYCSRTYRLKEGHH